MEMHSRVRGHAFAIDPRVVRETVGHDTEKRSPDANSFPFRARPPVRGRETTVGFPRRVSHTSVTSLIERYVSGEVMKRYRCQCQRCVATMSIVIIVRGKNFFLHFENRALMIIGIYNLSWR